MEICFGIVSKFRHLGGDKIMDSYRDMVERQERLLQFFEHDESMNSDDSEEDQEEE